MIKTKRTFHDRLTELSACEDAREWAKGFESAQKAWDACERGDWMLWIIGRTIDCEPWSDGRKPLVDCALDCAETVKHLWPKAQRDEIVEAVGVMRKWVNGEVAVAQAQEAKRRLWTAAAAYAAASAAAYAAAAATATDAAAAATAAAATAAATATDAAAANAAADADAAYAARADILKQCAAIVRKHYPKPPR